MELLNVPIPVKTDCFKDVAYNWLLNAISPSTSKFLCGKSVPTPSFAVDGINDNLEVFTFIDVVPIPVANVGNATSGVELEVILNVVETPAVIVTTPIVSAPELMTSIPVEKFKIDPNPTFDPLD